MKCVQCKSKNKQLWNTNTGWKCADCFDIGKDLIEEFFNEHKGIDPGLHQAVVMDFIRFLMKKSK